MKYIVIIVLVAIFVRFVFSIANINLFSGQDWALGAFAALIVRFIES